MGELYCLPVRERGIAFTLCWPNDHDYQYRQVRRFGRFYEFPFLRYIARVGATRHFNTAFDIGTCFGHHAVYFARIIGCHVECFEPNDALLAVIRVNLTNSGADARIHNVAVGATEQRGSLEIAEANLGASKMIAGENGETRIVSLDRYVAETDLPLPDFVKIDTEGFEGAVLGGARDVIGRSEPEIFIEISKAREADVPQLLASMGYRRIASFGRNHHFSRRASAWERVRLRVFAKSLRFATVLTKKWIRAVHPERW